MRGPIDGVAPLVAPVFYCFKQVREDLARHTDGLSPQQVWKVFGRASLGFHIRHMGGSIERLATYLDGKQLNETQLEALKHEADANQDLPALLATLNQKFAACEEQLRTLKPETLYDKRSVGRRALPTSVIGLIVHICEHTQRHLGQAITLAQLLRSGQ